MTNLMPTIDENTSRVRRRVGDLRLRLLAAQLSNEVMRDVLIEKLGQRKFQELEQQIRDHVRNGLEAVTTAA